MYHFLMYVTSTGSTQQWRKGSNAPSLRVRRRDKKDKAIGQ